MQACYFERNFYLTNFLDNQNFDNDEKLFDFVRQHPQFHYSSITNYQNFSDKYIPDGWLGRKILAIPKGMYHGVTEIITILAILLFEGFTHCRFALFSSIRHIQISLGHFASLFNDQYGLYHVQEGDFYLTCYKCWRHQNAVIVLDENGHGALFA